LAAPPAGFCKVRPDTFAHRRIRLPSIATTRHNAGIVEPHVALDLMATQPPGEKPATAPLPLAVLRRARLHAELAGLPPLQAARAVTHAQRRGGEGAGDLARFWRALYIALAPLPSDWQRLGDLHADALAALPLEARTALLLRLGEGMQPPAIAQALDEPQARAAEHLAQAVARLRTMLSGGRADPVWLSELSDWLHAHEPAAARLQRATRPALTAPSSGPDWARDGKRRPHLQRSLWLWLFLALLLATIGYARLTADRWMKTSDAPSVTAPVDPVEAWRTLSAEDQQLIASQIQLEPLARLDFFLWLANKPQPSAAPDVRPPDGASIAVDEGEWTTLTPAKHARRLQRLQHWLSMAPAERAALRLNLPHWLALSEAGRHAVVHQQGQYAALPDADRGAHDAEFDALSPQARRALLPVTVDTDHLELARELFPFIPLDQQAETLAMLDALNDAEISQLRQLTRRLPPWQREQLRVQLLAEPAPARAEWLAQRLSGD
jgi:DNA-directed RNA polymerase specialized sigma24 family protein